MVELHKTYLVLKWEVLIQVTRDNLDQAKELVMWKSRSRIVMKSSLWLRTNVSHKLRVIANKLIWQAIISLK